MAACASFIAFLTRGSFSAASALSKAGQRAGVARFEHRLRRVVALAGVGRHQRQTAERRVDDAAQPVVDDDGVDVVRRRAFDRLAGRRVEQLVVRGLDVDFLLRGAEHQPRILQGSEHLRGQGVAAGDHFVDRLAGIAQRAFGESDERVLVGTGMCRRREGEDKTEGAYERHHAIVEATHCSHSRRRLSSLGGGGLTRRLRGNHYGFRSMCGCCAITTSRCTSW